MRILTAEDIEEYEDTEQLPLYCPICIERGYQNRLGPKIPTLNEPRPDDYEDWFECSVCGYIRHYNEIPVQEEIQDTIEKQTNPHEDRLQLVSIPTRAAEKGKKPRGKKVRRKNRNKLDDDPEIDALMRIYGEQNVRVVFDSDP